MVNLQVPETISFYDAAGNHHDEEAVTKWTQLLGNQTVQLGFASRRFRTKLFVKIPSFYNLYVRGRTGIA